MLWFILRHFFSSILSISSLSRFSDSENDLEIMVLHHQLAVLQRKLKQPSNPPVKTTRIEKMTLAVLVHMCSHP